MRRRSRNRAVIVNSREDEDRNFKLRFGQRDDEVGRVSPGVATCPDELALQLLVDLGTAWSSGAGL